jgi:Ca-activated chloride channel family protein
MWGQMDGKTKMEIASSVLNSTMSNLETAQKVGLVAYGHRKKSDCKDVEFLVDFSEGSASEVSKAVSTIKPLGKTPLAYSASLVIDKLRSSKTKATIILLTDGVESCDGNICEVVKAAKAEGIDFKLHIIGFGLKPGDSNQLKCAATAGDGNYYDAVNAEGLSSVLNEAVEQNVDKPNGNFGIYAEKNGEPVDAYIKVYNAGTEVQVGTIRTYGRTGMIFLPAGKYDLVANPIQSKVNKLLLKNIENVEGEITIENISFTAGTFRINCFNNGKPWDAVLKVFDKEGNLAASSRTYNRERDIELSPGTYKVSFLALNLKGLDVALETEFIQVNAGGVTPVTKNFESGILKIRPSMGGEIIDCIVSVNEALSGTNVANGRSYTKGNEFIINPGKYSVEVTPLGQYKDRPSQTIDVEVKKGDTVTKTVNF